MLQLVCIVVLFVTKWLHTGPSRLLPCWKAAGCSSQNDPLYNANYGGLARDLRPTWIATKMEHYQERQHRVCFKRSSSDAKVENANSSLSLLSWNVGSMARHSKDIIELLINESTHVFFAQEARTTPHELGALKHRFREVGYSVPWDATRQLACIARHGLNLCQTRRPDCVEGYRLGYFALQLRDTRVLLRNVHYPFEGPSERAKLQQELECVDIARCFIDHGDFNSQPCWRTGDHVLMTDVRTWRKNAGSPTIVSCIDGARLSDCFRGLVTTTALEPVSGAQHRPVKLVVHVQPLTSCCYKWGSWQTFPWSVKLGSELDGSPS